MRRCWGRSLMIWGILKLINSMCESSVWLMDRKICIFTSPSFSQNFNFLKEDLNPLSKLSKNFSLSAPPTSLPSKNTPARSLFPAFPSTLVSESAPLKNPSKNASLKELENSVTSLENWKFCEAWFSADTSIFVRLHICFLNGMTDGILLKW